MAERPIIMSAESVRAILEWRKTQTRRVVKPVPEGYHVDHCHWSKTGFALWYDDGGCSCRPVKCPYPVGTRLWVKEGFGWTAMFPTKMYDEAMRIAYPDSFTYRADDQEGNWVWRSPLFMPRWASRITLEVTDVRVQRLRGVTEDDAAEEGAGVVLCDHEYWDGDPDQYRKCFRKIWDEINGKKPGCSWQDDPWVWAFTFRRIDA